MRMMIMVFNSSMASSGKALCGALPNQGKEDYSQWKGGAPLNLKFSNIDILYNISFQKWQKKNEDQSLFIPPVN